MSDYTIIPAPLGTDLIIVKPGDPVTLKYVPVIGWRVREVGQTPMKPTPILTTTADPARIEELYLDGHPIYAWCDRRILWFTWGTARFFEEDDLIEAIGARREKSRA